MYYIQLMQKEGNNNFFFFLYNSRYDIDDLPLNKLITAKDPNVLKLTEIFLLLCYTF